MTVQGWYHTDFKIIATILTIIGGYHIVDILDEVELLDAVRGQQRRVTEVVGHHNRRIQRCEIQGSNRHIVVAPAGFNNRSSFVLLLATYEQEKYNEAF